MSFDDFTSCIALLSPTTSDQKSFTITPDGGLTNNKTYKIKLTTAIQDEASNALASVLISQFSTKNLLVKSFGKKSI